jgi:hypothetical protein
MLRRFAVSYFGGAVGAVASSLCLYLAARADLLSLIGVTLNPKLSWTWLEPRIVWGGIFGLGYPLVARLRYRPVRAGLLLSLVPSGLQLFYFFPQQGHGLLGDSFGTLTPFVVLAANAVWGWVVARTMIATGERGGGQA